MTTKDIKDWIGVRLIGVILFQFIFMVLILLLAADFLAPYFVLSINMVVIICLLLTIPLLGFRSKMMFTLSLFFWICAGGLYLIKFSLWSDELGKYAYEALLIGLALFVIELSRNKNEIKTKK